MAHFEQPVRAMTKNEQEKVLAQIGAYSQIKNAQYKTNGETGVLHYDCDGVVTFETELLVATILGAQGITILGLV